MRRFDCFIFHNELELLDIRLHELAGVVDAFVLVEATRTHAGRPKPLHFAENRERFAPWLDKIRHVVVDDLPDSGADRWPREWHQRNAILRGLTDAEPGDVVTVTDADEILRADVLAAYDPRRGPCEATLAMHYYYLNCRRGTWDKARVAPYADVLAASPERTRMSTPRGGAIADAGFHWSYLGGVQRIVEKLESFSHAEFDNDYWKNPERVARAMRSGADLFDRAHLGGYRAVPIDRTYPAHVRANAERYAAAGLAVAA
jgi:hypothetical protein